jgi:hypothetical protein
LDELTTRAYELVSAGDLARARTELEDGLAATEFDGSTVPPDLAEAASLYARLLLASGQPAEAHEWAAYAHGAAQRLYGAADERTVRDAATLAAALSRVGELPAAERLYRDVVARLAERDGPGSPQALAARADLATVLHATGQCRAARSELAGALAAHQAGYGVDEPAGIRMLARLAAMSRDCGDEGAAERHFARARTLAETYLPADHPVTVQVAALAAAPPDDAHPCRARPGATQNPATQNPAAQNPASQGAGGDPWWPPEQDADPDHPPSGPPARAGGNGGIAASPESGPGRDRPGSALVAPRVSRGHLAAPRRIPPVGHLPFAETLPEPAHPTGRAAGHHPPTRATGPAPARVQASAGQSRDGAVVLPSMVEPVQEPFPAPREDRYRGHDDPYRLDDPYRGRHLPAYRHPGADPGGDPGRDPGGYEPYPGRSRWATASLAAGLTVLGIAGGWFAATRLLGDEPAPARPVPADAPRTPEESAAAATAAPPTGLTLRDGRNSVALTWTYPAEAEGPVMVTGGRAGEPQRAFQTLAAGTTTYTVHGLPERVDYCFTVAVVYSTDQIARSAPVCTTRR